MWLSILFFWDMTLHQWLIGFRRLEKTLCPRHPPSIGPRIRQIFVSNGLDPITRWRSKSLSNGIFINFLLPNSSRYLHVNVNIDFTDVQIFFQHVYVVCCRHFGDLKVEQKIYSKYLIIKPNRYTNFSNVFWNETLHVSDSFSVHHQGGTEFHPDPACKLSTN